MLLVQEAGPGWGGPRPWGASVHAQLLQVSSVKGASFMGGGGGVAGLFQDSRALQEVYTMQCSNALALSPPIEAFQSVLLSMCSARRQALGQWPNVTSKF